MFFSEYTDIIKILGDLQMKNQLNFEVVSDEELMTINGGQNMSMTDGGFEWVYAGGKLWFRIV